jgi:P-type Ca2+ transporter type 2C
MQIPGQEGLTSKEAKEILKREGLNSLPTSKPKNLLSIGWRVVKEPMFILLITCGSIYIALGNLQ